MIPKDYAAILRERANAPHPTRPRTVENFAITKAEGLAIAEMLYPENGNSPISHHEIQNLRQFIHDQGKQMMAMGITIQLLRVYLFGPLEFEDSPEVVTYCKAWIQDGKFLPHKWPSQWPAVCKFLGEIGFMPLDGCISLPMDQIGDRVEAEESRAEARVRS